MNRRLVTSLSPLLLLLWLVAVLQLRAGRLGFPVVWHDEALTLNHLSKLSDVDLVIQCAGHWTTFGSIKLRFQGLTPGGGLMGVFHSMGPEANKGPLYFSLAYFWARWTGTDPAAVRALSALLGVALIPMTYLYAMELMNQRWTALVATMFVSGSPMLIQLSREARDYPLYLLLVVACNLTLLRAIRTGRWGAYRLAAVLGGLTSILVFPVLLSHLVFLFLVEPNRRWVRPACCAQLTALAVFSPWLLNVRANWQAIHGGLSWMSGHISPKHRLASILSNPFSFFDLGQLSLWLGLLLAVLVTVRLLKRKLSRVLLFLLCQCLGACGPLFLLDCWDGGRRIQMVKYMLPLPLSVAFLVAYLIGRLHRVRYGGMVAWGVALGLTLWELSNAGIQSRVEEPTQLHGHSLLEVSELVTRYSPTMPLLTGENGEYINFVQMLALSHRVPAEQRLWFETNNHLPEGLPRRFWLFNCPDALAAVVRTAGWKIRSLPARPLAVAFR